MAEVLLDAVSQVSEVPTAFTKIAFDGADIKKTDAYPLGTRALELHDSAVVSQFLSAFGRNKRDIVCDCERTNKPSMTQVLHIANGTTINEKLKSKESCVAKALELEDSPDTTDKIINEAYLKSLSRLPTEKEAKQLKQVFADAKDARKETIEDLYWSLMSSREFLFQH